MAKKHNISLDWAGRRGLVVKSTLETEFMGSNPGGGKVFFLLALFFFFLLLLHFRHHYEVQHYRGINSKPLKKAIEINLFLREEIAIKNPSNA